MVALTATETGTPPGASDTMTDAAADPADAAPEAPPSKRKLGLVVGVVAALALGGGGFYAVWSGLVDPAALIGGMGNGGGHGGGHGDAAPSDVAFVAMEPVMVSLPPGSSARLLRFTGQLEVAPEHAAEVGAVMPRVVDVLNTFLRAVEPRDLEKPAALAPLRAQMLRRIQVVTGEGRVRDLLITEFVLN
jgi:flagellar FliL protein